MKKVIDIHGHISQMEIQDIAELGSYDKELKYGMSPEDNLYLMDSVGVDMQLLHSTPKLLKYHIRILKKFPERFIAITKIDERLLPGDEGLELIRHQIEDLGFKGLFYDTWPPADRIDMGFDPTDWGTPDPFYHFDHQRYDPQWKLLESLGAPVCITSYPENFQTLCPAILNVIEKFPDLKVVIVHGIDPPSLLTSDGIPWLPESAKSLIDSNVYLELLPGMDMLPNKRGAPNRYGANDEVIKLFFDNFGPEKLMWGSEFTHIELPTLKQYKSQLDYIRIKCNYIDQKSLDMIMGGTAQSLYGI